nr:DNA binding protein [Microvirus sp.]
MNLNMYIVRDTVSHQNSSLVTAVSDECAIRDFAVNSGSISNRIAKDLMLVRVAELSDIEDNYPVVTGYPVPVPVCTLFEALQSVSEG